MTADELLAIKRPEDLYDNNVDKAKQMYKRLAKVWHPDHEDGRTDVFQHVKDLYEKALKKIEAGTWHFTDSIVVNTFDGRKFQVKYLTHVPFELGDMYVSTNNVVYLIRKDASDLVRRAKEVLSKVRYDSAEMEKEYSRYLPHEKLSAELVDGRRMVVYTKTPDLILMRDVIKHFNGKVDPKHAAWMVSRMLNVGSFLQHNRIVHNAIGPDSVFVSPKFHSVAVLGGWWYSARINDPIVALPSRTVRLVSTAASVKKGTLKTDGKLIRSTGLELLGSVTGSNLLMDKTVPKAMVSWLRDIPSGDTVKDYMEWFNKVLPDSFGARKFIELNLTAEEVYSPKP